MCEEEFLRNTTVYFTSDLQNIYDTSFPLCFKLQ